MRSLKSACGISSSLRTAADCQYTEMVLPSQPRVAGAGWPAEESCFKTNPLFCQISAALFVELDKGFKSFIASILAGAFWTVTLSWYRHLPWMAQDQFRGERWKKGVMFRHSVSWVKHLRSLIVMACFEKTQYFSPAEVFLYTLDDRVPASPTSMPRRLSFCIQIMCIS